MKAILYLKAENAEDEALIQTMGYCHFQTYVQDFLEDEADMLGYGSVVGLPDIVYIDKDGVTMRKVLQGTDYGFKLPTEG